jgi:SYP7 family syntaxin
MRKRCGKEDEEDKQPESTGDPFRDKTNQFTRDIAQVKEMILERNQGAKLIGQDRDSIEQSHDINKLLRQLDDDMEQIKAMVEQSERALAKANRKKKAQSKLMLLEQQLKGRQAAYEMCVEILASAKSMNDQRFGSASANLLAAANPTKKGKKAAPTPQMTIGKKMLLRQQLLDATRQRAEDASVAAAANGASPVNLEENPETADQMRLLKEQDRKINAGLDRLGKGVARLHELAIQIGSEIEVQNKLLEETEEKVEEQTKQLKQINKRLKALIKKSKPMHVFLNLFCFILLLALVGYFLYYFGVIK